MTYFPQMPKYEEDSSPPKASRTRARRNAPPATTRDEPSLGLVTLPAYLLIIFAFISIAVGCLSLVALLRTPLEARTAASIYTGLMMVISGVFLLMICGICLAHCQHVRRHWHRST